LTSKEEAATAMVEIEQRISTIGFLLEHGKIVEGGSKLNL